MTAGRWFDRWPGTSPGAVQTSVTGGPELIFDPAYLRIGTTQLFQAAYGTSPPGDETHAVAVVATAASGRRARAVGAERLEDGVRLRIALPIDSGLPAWEPRAAQQRDVFAFPAARAGRTKWLLELE